MNYYGSKELAESFRTVRKNTIQVAEEIPEDKYGFSPAPGARTVEKMLTHISLACRFPLQLHKDRRKNFDGFNFPEFFGKLMADEAQPRTKAQVIALLKESGEEWARFLEGLSEEALADTITHPAGSTPPSKSRFEMLTSVKEHEMHHRSQVMMAERLIGITPHLTRQMEARFAEMMKAQQKS